jgi:hypothetical protein
LNDRKILTTNHRQENEMALDNKSNLQAIITAQPALNPNQSVEEFALFNADGTPYHLPVYPVTTDTAIGTAGKTTTTPEPLADTIVPIKFTNGNSAANPTVAFNGGSARSIYLNGVAVAAADITVAANGVVLCWFDGTRLHQFGPYPVTVSLITTATVIGTAAKTTTSPEPLAGAIVPIKFTNGNSAETPTVAFNGGAARAIKLGGTAVTAAKCTVAANGVVNFYFDGTVLHQFGAVN